MFDAVLSGGIIALEAVGAAAIIATDGSALYLMASSLIRQRHLAWYAAPRMLGRGLVLALDFLIVADILRTMVAPSLDEIWLLAGIIALRTILSLTIEHELRQMPREADEGGP